MNKIKWIFGKNQLSSLDKMDYRDSQKTLLKNRVHQPNEEKNGYIENKNKEIENGYIPDGHFHLLNGNIKIFPKNVITLENWDANNQISIPNITLNKDYGISVYSFDNTTGKFAFEWIYTPQAYIDVDNTICNNSYRFKITDNTIILCSTLPAGYTTIAFIYTYTHLYQKYDKLLLNENSLLMLNISGVTNEQ